MPWRTSTRQEGPYLVITRCPGSTTQEQLSKALDAAHTVFAAAGYDPVQVGMGDTEDAFEGKQFADLWAEAERAATVAAWAPRPGEPEPTMINIYIE
jgi:hypothetical protein